LKKRGGKEGWGGETQRKRRNLRGKTIKEGTELQRSQRYQGSEPTKSRAGRVVSKTTPNERRETQARKLKKGTLNSQHQNWGEPWGRQTNLKASEKH